MSWHHTSDGTIFLIAPTPWIGSKRNSSCFPNTPCNLSLSNFVSWRCLWHTYTRNIQAVAILVPGSQLNLRGRRRSLASCWSQSWLVSTRMVIQFMAAQSRILEALLLPKIVLRSCLTYGTTSFMEFQGLPKAWATRAIVTSDKSQLVKKTTNNVIERYWKTRTNKCSDVAAINKMSLLSLKLKVRIYWICLWILGQSLGTWR